ncbi:MAG: exodeoxyribonuclease VII large subunit, partial [Sphaerochaeta sp.]|nr:exodeoxyribonuclease VII large subunit [Sphaerochaeta sp.]
RRRLYESKGYFAQELKSPIPRYPKRIGVVTSAGGAALQDILNITERRAPMLDILVLPAVVQGSTAAQTIANRIRQANELLLCDVLIVGRGGGSLEDLLPFSEECVIEAIHDSLIPVISAVGHEIDWALSDYVADLRAPTPSAAAELVSQGYLDLQVQAKALKMQVARSMQTKLLIAQQRLKSHDRVIGGKRMEAIFSGKEYLLANASQNLATSMRHLLIMTTSRLHTAQRELQALSPLAILARGYCVVQDTKQHLVRSAKQAPKGTKLSLTFIDGSRKAVVEE